MATVQEILDYLDDPRSGVFSDPTSIYSYKQALDGDFYHKILSDEQKRAGLDGLAIRLMVPELPGQPPYGLRVEREEETTYQIIAGRQLNLRGQVREAMWFIKYGIFDERIPRPMRSRCNALVAKIITLAYNRGRI